MNKVVEKYIYTPTCIVFSSFFIINKILNKINKKNCLLCAGRFFTAEFWLIFWTTNSIIYNIITNNSLYIQKFNM
mgnify:CR=1 FL=1